MVATIVQHLIWLQSSKLFQFALCSSGPERDKFTRYDMKFPDDVEFKIVLGSCLHYVTCTDNLA